MNVGDFVKYRAPLGKDNDVYGRVQAVENFRDTNGMRTWVYVRWVSEGGMPQERDIAHHLSELVLIEEAPCE